MRRVTTLLSFVGGVALAQVQPELPPLPTAAALAAAAGAAFVAGLRSRRRRAAGWLLPIGAMALGFAYTVLLAGARLADELAHEHEGRDVRIVGVVSSLPARDAAFTRFEFVVERVETPVVHVPRRVSLAWYARDVAVRPAERWALTVRLRRPHGTLNPGGFDTEAWLFERELRASGYVRDGAADAPIRLAPMVWTFDGAVNRARERLRAALQARLDGLRHGGVLVALVLGDQRAITDADWQRFHRTGIAHLVSISGLHITMIAGLAAVATAAIWRRSRRLLASASVQAAGAGAATIFAFAYCLLAGWGVPAQRTFFMLATVAAAVIVRARAGAATTLALAAAVVCALDPWAVVAPGFWLSFGAVAAILFVAGGHAAPRAAASARARWVQRMRDAVRVQLGVTLALVPLTIALFRHVSLVSPAANAIAIPVVSLLVTPLSLVAAALVVLPAPFSSLAAPLLAVAHLLFALLADVVAWFAAWPLAAVALPAPPAWTLVVALAGVAWLLAPRGWPARWLGAVALLPLVALPAPRPRAGELWVTALDVGQGMAVVVQTRERALLYDAGPRYASGSDAGSRIVVPYLRWHGIRRLDWLVVSHLDTDHSGGAAAVRAALPVGAVLTSVDAAHPVVAGAARVHRCAAGQSWPFDAGAIDVLHPGDADYMRPRATPNALSCVVRVRLGPVAVLLTGDIAMPQETELLARTEDVRATLVSAPHHGSRSSSGARFVAAVGARWVAVQAGYRNRFGHPAPDVVARWQQAGASVVRTDDAGAIQWRFAADGRVAVTRWRDAARRYFHARPRARAAPQADAAEGADNAAAATGTEVASPASGDDAPPAPP